MCSFFFPWSIFVRHQKFVLFVIKVSKNHCIESICPATSLSIGISGLRPSSRSFGKSAASPQRSRHRVLPDIPDARDHRQTPFIPVWRMSGAVCFAEVCSEAMELFMQFAFALYRVPAMCSQGTGTESANSQHFLCALGTFALHVSLKAPQARLGAALLLN